MASLLFLLSTFAEELTPAWCPIFQQSLDSHTVLASWKKTVITPVPKKPCPTDNNDYRPIALTSIVMKCLEKKMFFLTQSRYKSTVKSFPICLLTEEEH